MKAGVGLGMQQDTGHHCSPWPQWLWQHGIGEGGGRVDIALTWSSPLSFSPVESLGSGCPSVTTSQLEWCSAACSLPSLVWGTSGISTCSGTLYLSRYESALHSIFVSLKERSLEVPGHPQVRADRDMVSLLQSQAPAVFPLLSHDTEPPPFRMAELTLTFPFFYRSVMGLFRPQAGHLW